MSVYDTPVIASAGAAVPLDPALAATSSVTAVPTAAADAAA